LESYCTRLISKKIYLRLGRKSFLIFVKLTLRGM